MTWVSYAQSFDRAEPGNRVLGGAQLSAPIAQGVQGVMPCTSSSIFKGLRHRTAIAVSAATPWPWPALYP